MFDNATLDKAMPNMSLSKPTNIIYTGVTRAKQNVALIGQTEALNTAILNNQTDVRHTLLGDRLHAAFTVKS